MFCHALITICSVLVAYAAPLSVPNESINYFPSLDQSHEPLRVSNLTSLILLFFPIPLLNVLRDTLLAAS